MRRFVIATLLLLAGAADAGDRRLAVLFSNMTPDAASSEASKACVKAIDARIRADYSEVTRMGETPMRKLVGKSGGEPFLEWTSEEIAPIKQRDGRYVDAVVLIDCRPETQTLDVLIHPSMGGIVRFALRRVTLDKKAATVAAEAILRRAWTDFSP